MNSSSLMKDQDDTPIELLRRVFGYDQFRGHQQTIIDTLLAGGDCLVLMPTGGGKSLCYQIPALMRPGTGIVVSPLIALMADQVMALQNLGIKAAYLNSTLSMTAARNIERDLLQGRLDLLYVAPERLLTEQFLALLAKSEIALFAIDEAHCVSQWGHDFRPEYTQLSVLHARFPQVPRIALTATADQRTREEIIAQLNLQTAKIFISSFDRPNIHYRIQEKNNPKQQLLDFLRNEHLRDAGIVYCMSRKKTEDYAEFLRQQGFHALAYHAGLDAQTRALRQQSFLRDEAVIMVATIAFGMGIDKPDVRFVAHVDLPKSIEAYYQETGRAGRDGMPAHAWMIYGLQDVIQIRRLMQESQAPAQQKRVEQIKLDALLGLCESFTCRRRVLLNYFAEDYAQACGNCDVCAGQIETWDATEAAQKALSCIYRSGQGFGAAYIVDLLQGKTSERILANRHHELSTFGIGKDLHAVDWRRVLRQLLALGLVAVDFEKFGALRLQPACREILRGEQRLQLVKSQSREKPIPEKRASKSKSQAGAHGALWDALRACRRRLADAQGVPPYVIFHDATLMTMAEVRPKNLTELRTINGVGDAKLQRYGEEFLHVIRSHSVLDQKIESTDQSIALFLAGKSIADIATVRALATNTVYSHLAVGISRGELQVEQVVELSLEEIRKIQAALVELGGAELRLKPVFDHFEGKYGYECLRCIQASCR